MCVACECVLRKVIVDHTAHCRNGAACMPVTHAGSGMQAGLCARGTGDLGSDQLISKFYAALRADGDHLFAVTYRAFVRHVLQQLYPSDTSLIFQTWPSIRLQYPGQTVVPWHSDDDELSQHPPGEVRATPAPRRPDPLGGVRGRTAVPRR